jgi:sugar lactone lactonase YvrE
VFRLETATGRVERFSDGPAGEPFRIPNSLAFDAEGRLYVSDSHAFRVPGRGVVRIDAGGRAEWWWDPPLNFANGIALSPDGAWLYVVETFGCAVSRIEIRDDGSAGRREEVFALEGTYPDGLAFDVEGNLYVGCYEPSEVLRVDRRGAVDVLYREISVHTLAHPTNVAFRGSTMFTANLGRWHVTRLEVGIDGVTLPPGRR